MSKANTSLTPIYYSTYELQFCSIAIASTNQGVCACFQGTNSVTELLIWLKKHFHEEQIHYDQEANRHVEIQLQEYFAGKRQQFDFTYDLYGTDFQIHVWQELQKIPYGKTITYGELAKRVGGSSNYSRAVGSANNKNPISILIPCHRVIGSNGKLIGYAGGLEMKNKLLQLENGCLDLLQSKNPVH